MNYYIVHCRSKKVGSFEIHSLEVDEIREVYPRHAEPGYALL